MSPTPYVVATVQALPQSLPATKIAQLATSALKSAVDVCPVTAIHKLPPSSTISPG